jgi:sulfite reductase alpha subunit-like flavoprotein
LSADELSVFRDRLAEVGLGGGGGAAHCAEEEGHIIVWHGSHTGTAESLAQELVAKATQQGIDAVSHDLAGFSPSRFLDNDSRVVLLLATHGVVRAGARCTIQHIASTYHSVC